MPDSRVYRVSMPSVKLSAFPMPMSKAPNDDQRNAPRSSACPYDDHTTRDLSLSSRLPRRPRGDACPKPKRSARKKANTATQASFQSDGLSMVNERSPLKKAQNPVLGIAQGPSSDLGSDAIHPSLDSPSLVARGSWLFPSPPLIHLLSPGDEESRSPNLCANYYSARSPIVRIPGLDRKAALTTPQLFPSRSVSSLDPSPDPMDPYTRVKRSVNRMTNQLSYSNVARYREAKPRREGGERSRYHSVSG
jgi:hypothetical protein